MRIFSGHAEKFPWEDDLEYIAKSWTSAVTMGVIEVQHTQTDTGTKKIFVIHPFFFVFFIYKHTHQKNVDSSKEFSKFVNFGQLLSLLFSILEIYPLFLERGNGNQRKSLVDWLVN